jgi:hypothetical protein
MTKTRSTLIAAAALASSLFVASASAQNNPPPGNVNPGSMNSGAEESGAESQPRSFDQGDGPRTYFGGSAGYGAYATPYSPSVNTPALGYSGSPVTPRGAPPFGGGYDD